MIEIKVPATSANVGAGFDCLGLAVQLYNTVYIENSDKIEVESLDGSFVPKGASNMIYKSATRLFEECGKKLYGLKIGQKNDIPMTRGLGSSSACVVAGLLGANLLLNNPLDTSAIIDLAAKIEGHPDNSTPAIVGGFVASVNSRGKIYYTKIDIGQKLKFAAFIPDYRLKTDETRTVLPTAVTHQDAVYNLSRAVLMAASLSQGRCDNLKAASGDKLHQPYRIGLIKGGEQIFKVAHYADDLCTYISGSGPTIMSIIDANNINFKERAEKKLAQLGLDSIKIHIFNMDNNGAQVLTL